MEAGGAHALVVAVGPRPAAGPVLAGLRVAEVALGEDGGVLVPGPRALEEVAGAGQQQLVLHGPGRGALGDAWLDVVRLDPLRQPAHVAVAVEGVGAEGAEHKALITDCSDNEQTPGDRHQNWDGHKRKRK